MTSAPAVKRFNPQAFDSEAFRVDPYPFYKRLRDHWPVYHDRLHNLVHVTRYEDIIEIVKDDERFNTRPHRYETDGVIGPTILTQSGREHTETRNIVAAEIVGSKLGAFQPAVEKAARDLISQFADDGSVDLAAQFTNLFPLNVIIAMLGLPMEDRHLFDRWFKEMMGGMGWDDEARVIGIKARRELGEYLDPFLVEFRKDPPEGSLISKLITTELHGRTLDDEEIKTFIALLLSGGGETTDRAIANMWWNLLRHPELMAEIVADPSLLDRAFTETMRHSPPVHAEPREPFEDLEIQSVLVPAGIRMQLSYGSGNRDERIFKDPDRFDIYRDDLHFGKELRSGVFADGKASHLGFGLGKHFCLGYQLARQEAVIGSKFLLEAMKNPRLEVPEQAGIVASRESGGTRSVADLRVRFDPA